MAVVAASTWLSRNIPAWPAIIAVGGPERMHMDAIIARVRHEVLAGGPADFNHDRVSARERSAEQVLMLARQMPMMAPRRLIEVKAAQAMSDKGPEEIEAYIANASSDSVVLLCFDELDGRTRLVKLLEKAPAERVVLVKCDRPREHDMPDLLMVRAATHQLKFTDNAIDALLVAVGTDLGLLERALEKLALVPGAQQGPLNEDVVGAHIAQAPEELAFRFATALLSGNAALGLTMLARMEGDKKTEPIALVGAVTWQLRQVLLVRECLDAKVAVPAKAKLFGDRLSATTRLARGQTALQWLSRLAQLSDLDMAMKRSRTSPWLMLTQLAIDWAAEPTSTTRSSSHAAQRSVAP